MFEICLKHVSNGFKTRLNVFQTKTPKKRFTISPLFIWRVTFAVISKQEHVRTCNVYVAVREKTQTVMKIAVDSVNIGLCDSPD